MDDTRNEGQVPQENPVPQPPAEPAGAQMPPVPGAPATPAPEPAAPETPAPEPAPATQQMPSAPQPGPAAPVPPAPQPEPATQQMPPAPPAQPTDQNPWNGQQGAPVPPQQGAAPGGYPPAPGNGFAAAPAKKSNTGLIVGLVAAVVIILILVVVFVLPNMGGSSDPAPISEPSAVEEPAPSDEPANSEEAVQAIVADELDLYVAHDPEVLGYIGDIVSEGFENQMNGYTLEDCGVDPREYADVMLDGFTYEIGSAYVSESEGTAIVDVTVDCRDVFNFLDRYNEMFDAYSNSEEYQTTTLEEDLARVGTMFMEAARNTDMLNGYNFTAELNYEDGSWEIDEDSWEEVMDYLFDVE